MSESRSSVSDFYTYRKPKDVCILNECTISCCTAEFVSTRKSDGKRATGSGRSHDGEVT